MIKVRYIYHDCFLIEVEDKCSMIFDYWKDGKDAPKDVTPDFVTNLNPNLPCYVFVSHHHKDHLNRVIFEWGADHGNLFYILSKDTARFVRHILREDSVWNGYKLPASRYRVLTPGEGYSDDVIKISAFGSTDIGNSYLVNVGENSFFHAGDLNAWIWKDESTDEEIEKSLKDYRKILDDIASVAVNGVDVVMFPVDSRIGTDYFTGAVEWLNKITTRFFLPMHFELATGEEELKQRKEDAASFERYAPRNISTVFAALQSRGDSLAFSPVPQYLLTLDRGDANL